MGPCPPCHIRVRAILRLCYIRVTPLYPNARLAGGVLCREGPRKALRTLNQSHFWKISSTFGDKCPQNGSKNGQTAPRTGRGCPHKGPYVERVRFRKVDVRLSGKGNSTSHIARPVHLIITLIEWIRTRRLSMKKWIRTSRL